MSLIFDSLKKGEKPSASPAANQAPDKTLAEPAAPAGSSVPRLDTSESFVSMNAPRAIGSHALVGNLMVVFASVVTGIVLAATGAWLYWKGQEAGIEKQFQTSRAAHSTGTLSGTPNGALPAEVAVTTQGAAPQRSDAAAKTTQTNAPPNPGHAASAPVASTKTLTSPAAGMSVTDDGQASAPSSPSAPPAPPPAQQAGSAVRPAVKPSAMTSAPTQLEVLSVPIQLDVREVFQNFLRLTQAGQFDDAQKTVEQLSRVLGRSHVMTLRAEGYLALKRNNLAQARSSYSQLQSLLPDDREAGLNLALIDWRSGDKDAAARRAGSLLEKYPSDPEIRALASGVRTP